MKKEMDAYGREIWDYYKGEKKIVEIVERDDGFIDVSSGPKTYFAKFRNWPAHEKKAMAYVRGRVLDIGCGAGRHCLWLQRKRFSVTGIDNSLLAIKVCRLRGLKNARVMSITEVNFKPDSFDTILMLGNNFGLFGSFKGAKRLLRKFYKMTGKGARIIVESLDPYKTKKRAHLEYQKLNRKRGRMSGQVRIRIRYDKYKGKWFDYLLVSKKEMKGILKGTGWRVKRFIDSKKGPMYIAIIEKVKK